MTPSRRHLHWLIIAAGTTFAASWAHHGYADAPPERYVANNGTVLDTKTNLTWQQNHQGAGLDWEAAKNYCAGLFLNGIAGWRLPTIKELQTIVDEKKTNPAIDTSVNGFPMTPSVPFWTSSPGAGPSSPAWFVNFYNGYVNYDSGAHSYRVRCVRNQ